MRKAGYQWMVAAGPPQLFLNCPLPRP
jgi:hypothetical protein